MITRSRRVKVPVAAALSAAALALTACSSPAGDTETLQTASSSTSTAPTAAAPPVLKKGIGEAAWWGCDSSGETKGCDIQFRVNAITRGEQCPRNAGQYGVQDNEEVVRVDLEVDTADAFKRPEISPFLLFPDNWSITGSDGFRVSGPDVAIECDVDANLLYRELEPGVKQRASVPFVAPKGSTTVTLTKQGYGFEWEIPETTSTADAVPTPVPLTSAGAPSSASQVVETALPAPSPDPVGFTGAPNGSPAPLIGKTIDYCMTDPSYQTGTTMFTDGTTGWTQHCANGR
ncbi:hypothetical protein [Prescottella equi]|uniref:hypothetical protein n=1 Tax=Rhodococcus hoagii TaxID=43767 RepID=UPI001585763C|nr:hypothetical protein [Prescottella equi]MBU4616637.1 hypothetical protein [Rhodococcus sp. GG48]